MKRYLTANKILLALTAAAVVVSLAVIAGRWRVESRNKTYDVILDYSELALLAEQSEHDISWWLEQFRDIGITQVGLTEESLDSMTEDPAIPLTAVPLGELVQEPQWQDAYPASIIDGITQFGYDRFDEIGRASCRERVLAGV